jgi:hypothetical protein
MSDDGFPRSVMNIYWNEGGDVHVSRFIPGEWETALRAEGAKGDWLSPADAAEAARLAATNPVVALSTNRETAPARGRAEAVVLRGVPGAARHEADVGSHPATRH